MRKYNSLDVPCTKNYRVMKYGEQTINFNSQYTFLISEQLNTDGAFPEINAKGNSILNIIWN